MNGGSVAESLRQLTNLTTLEGDYERAAVLGEDCLAASRAEGDLRARGMALLSLGSVRLLQERLEQAATHFVEGLALLRQVGDTSGIAATLTGQSVVAQSLGNITAADSMLAEALTLCRDLGDDRSTYYAATVAVGRLVSRGALEPTARLVAALDFHRERTTLVAGVMEQVNLSRATAAARAALGEAAFTAAWKTGRELSVGHILDEVLVALTNSPTAGSVVGPPETRQRSAGRLSKRENEVLQLVASGLSNPQIAERLVITPRTAKFHLASIMEKLGASSRAQAVALASQLDLLETDQTPRRRSVN
jgi:non-specific serine/threonine protein kinase